MVDYAWSHAVISDETRKNLMSWEISSNYTWTDSNFTDEFYRHYHEIDIFSLYTPTCVPESSGSKEESIDIGTSRTLLNMVIDLNFSYSGFSLFSYVELSCEAYTWPFPRYMNIFGSIYFYIQMN